VQTLKELNVGPGDTYVGQLHENRTGYPRTHPSLRYHDQGLERASADYEHITMYRAVRVAVAGKSAAALMTRSQMVGLLMRVEAWAGARYMSGP
jgi:hypothetical protein